MRLNVFPTRELRDKFLAGNKVTEYKFDTFDGFVWKCIADVSNDKREIDDNEKQYIIYRIMKSADLGYFREVRRGYAAGVSRAIGELKLQGITADKAKMLLVSGQAWPDIVNIYEWYQKFLFTHDLYDREDRFIICVDNIKTCSHAKGFDKIFFNDFYYFTPIQEEIIKCLGEKAETWDACLRHKATVSVVRARDIFGECYGLADSILKDLSDGLRYDDIAVVTRDGSYRNYIHDSLSTRGIPTGFELQSPVISNPLVKSIILSITGDGDTIRGWLESIKSSVPSAESLALNIMRPENLRGNLEARKTFLKILDSLLFVENTLHDERLLSRDAFKSYISSALKGAMYVDKPNLDGIRIFSPLNIRGLDFKKVYLAGAYEGCYPRTFSMDWLLKDTQRREINQQGFKLDTVSDLITRENLSWDFLISCCEEIKASYPIMGPGDSPAMPSRFVSVFAAEHTLELKDVFPVSRVDLKKDKGLRIRGISKTEFTVSEINDYGCCPYMYYLKNVLNLSPTPEETFNGATSGRIYHEALKRFYLKHVNELEADRKDEYDEEISQILTDIYDESMAEILENENEKNLQRDIMSDKLKDFLNSEADKSYGGTLMKVEYPVQLNLYGMTVSGRIDRLDKINGGYLAIDYKKGYTPNLSDAANGTDIQLPIYIMAVENHFGSRCGGIYLSIESKKRQPIILKEMGTFGFNKNNKGLFTRNEWDAFFNKIRETLLGYITGIRNGEFPQEPRKCPKTDAYGAYCDFADICSYKGGE